VRPIHRLTPYQRFWQSKPPEEHKAHLEHQRKSRIEHPEYQPNYQPQYQHHKRLRAYLILGFKCSMCNTKNMLTFHIDHINGINNSIAPFNKRYHGTAIYNMIIKNPESAKSQLQILCANCHMIKTKSHKEHTGRHALRKNL